MKTKSLVTRFVLTLIGFSLSFFYVGAVGQTLTVNDIPDQTINLGQSFSNINLDDYIDVPPGQKSKIQWNATGATELSVNIDNGRKASIVPLSDTWTGSETITFHAIDTDQNTGSDAATFTIKKLENAPPVVSGIPDQQLTEGSAFQPVNLDDFVTDADNAKNELTWSASGNTSLSVDINPNTHTAIVAAPNTDWNGSETIVFKATDPASASSQDEATFTLTPVNDSPVVSDIPDQSIKSGESFTTITLDNYVNDVDNSKSELTWSVTGNTSLTPTVDGSHIATISKPANWSGSETLTFTATDPANASASDNATFTLLASAPTDINLSNSSVAENLPLSTAVGTLSTVDADGGDTFVYTLVPGAGAADNPSFDITGNSLVTKEIFDFENKATYHTRVRATTDQDGQFIEKPFTIIIANVNEAPTDISLSNSSIADHQPVNTVVATISSTDPDAGDSFTYTLVSGTGSTDNASFNISGNQLRTSAVFDFSTKSSYSIRLRTTDAGTAFFEKSFTITVTNSNNAPTDITISNSTIAEHQPANTLVGTLSTSDPDAGDSFTYTLVSGTGSTDNASFNISGSQLRATNTLNFETKSSYSVRVRSTDAASAFFEKQFTITVTNSNEPPTDITLSNNTIDENLPANTVVGILSSTDLDIGDTYTYTLVAGTGSTDNSSFNISGANLRATSSLNFETKSSYSVRIRTTDAGGLTFEKAFTITVNNVNETPTNIVPSDNTIADHQPINTVVATLSTSDPDAGDSFTYTLVSGSGSADNASFNISGNQLRTSAVFDFTTKSSYSIRLRTTDAGSAFFEKSFAITVTNSNNAPTDITISNSVIAEHQPANTIVGSLSTTDPDAGDSFTYTLVSGTGSTDNASFNISGSQLRATNTLNFETKSSYSVRVRSTDAANAFFEKQFTITVTNVNETPTDITLSDNTIAENLPANTVVGTLTTTDLDIADAYTYTLVSGTGSTDNASFNISGNSLRATSPLNFETKSSYSVRIRTTDAGNATFEKAFTITVTNVNESPTDIILSASTVLDKQPVNTTVATITSTDPDIADVFTYTLVPGVGSTDNASFNISGNLLRTSAVFDFLIKSSYTIRIRSTDAGTAFFEKSFTITITSSNNPPTDITLSSSSIAENQPANSVVGNLTATDADAGESFIYSLVTGTGSTDNASFNILGTQLRANLPLNFEVKSSYSVRIRVTDAATASFEKVFIITVLNVNEPPSITSVSYTVDGRIGVLHTGSFTGYLDPEGDAPGVHLYQWYISDNASGIPATAIPGATGLTYRPVSSDGGKYLCFEVTPVDIVGTTGIPLKSAFRRVNDAPVATNAYIYAPVALPGQTARARFSYSDAEGNPRGTGIYQWYRKNTNVINYGNPGTPIGTDSTYLLKNTEAGKYIWFKVKPTATAGSTPGDSIWSIIIGPIGTFNASISGTAGYCSGLPMPITLTISGGIEPFTAVLTRSGSSSNKDTTITGITGSPHVIQVKIAGSYVLKSLTDASTPTPDNATVTPDAVVLSHFAKPSAVLAGGAAICNDGLQQSAVNINFTGTSPWTFTIRRGNAGNDSTFSAISSDPYTFKTRIISAPMSVRLVAISDAHCTGDTTGSGTLRLSYLPSPIASIQGQDSICPAGTGSLKVTISGTPGPWGITYKKDGANPTDVSNIQTSPYTLSVQGTGNFTLSKVTQNSGCTGKVSGTGKIIPFVLPTATISGNATFCQYTTGNLNVNLTGKSPWKFSYKLNSESPVEVLNVSSSPNPISISKAGTYTLVDVFDKNCKGSTSGSANVTITPAPVVSLSGLAPAYNKDSSEMVHLIGTPSGGTFSGPGVIPYFSDWYFLTSLPPAGTHNIVYSYRESPSSCYGYDTAVVRVLKANAIIEFPDNRQKYCQNEFPFVITGVNLANNVGHFVISGGIGLADHGDNTATVDPSMLGVKEYTITYTYFDGTTLNVTTTFEVGRAPIADFRWESECFSDNQAINFKSASLSTFGNITAYQWKVYTTTGFDTASTPEISHTFPEPGNHVVELQVKTSYGCSGIVSKVFDLRPTLNPKADGFKTESFENAPLSWRSETPASSMVDSWTLGNPHDPTGIHGAFSDTSCWYTNIPSTNAPREQSWVTSPCYDFTGMKRPMVKLQIWRDFNGRRDGTVLQATTDSAKSWFNIGQLGDGLTWFNEYSILGNPGINQQIGWSNIQDGGWKEARHSLDMLKGKTRVQFRIAYGSDGTVQNTDGFAFDNFFIGERDRRVLIEHFTNSSDAASETANALLNGIVDADTLNTMDLQYHTDFPGNDPFNAQEPYAPLARRLYYGISQVPYSILNGGYDPAFRFDYSKDNKLDANLVHLESLNDAIFTLEFSESSWNGNTANFTIQCGPKNDMEAHEFTIHAGILERKVAGTGPHGDTIYENVVKALLPNPETVITVFEPWAAGVRKEKSFSWEITEGSDKNQIMAFAFIQDEESHEVYQTNLVKIGFATSIHEVQPSGEKFIVFPNPARDQAFIRFDKPVKGEVRIEMFNNLGSLVYSGIIPGTDSDTEINTEKYPDGLYILRVSTGNKLLGIAKLNISR